METTPEHWVLIRGLIRSRFHWGEFPGQLEHGLQYQNPGITLITPELAGNGERWQEKTPSGVHGMMEDIRRQVRESTPGPVTLVAISMGAMIASEWARCYPNEINGLHLVNTSFSNFSFPWQRMRATAFLSLMLTIISRQPLEAAILHWTSNRKDSPELAPIWQEFAQEHPLSKRNALIQLLSASGYRGPRQSPVRPVYCYVSEADRLVSHRCTQRIANAWQAPLSVHHSAGHDLPLDDPAWLIGEIVGNSQTPGESQSNTGFNMTIEAENMPQISRKRAGSDYAKSTDIDAQNDF